MRNLRELGLVELIQARVEQGTPLLGICLGMQLLFDALRRARHDPRAGADRRRGHAPARRRTADPAHRLERGSVRARLAADSPGCRSRLPLLPRALVRGAPADGDTIVGTAEYGERFATFVGRGSVFGVQFHPEKSSLNGLRMLDGFVGICAGVAGVRA